MTELQYAMMCKGFSEIIANQTAILNKRAMTRKDTDAVISHAKCIAEDLQAISRDVFQKTPIQCFNDSCRISFITEMENSYLNILWIYNHVLKFNYAIRLSDKSIVKFHDDGNKTFITPDNNEISEEEFMSTDCDSKWEILIGE